MPVTQHQHYFLGPATQHSSLQFVNINNVLFQKRKTL